MEIPGSNPGGSTNTKSFYVAYFIMKLSAAVETGSTGLWYGRFIDLVGSHARAEIFDQLMVELRAEAFYHDSWLRRYGEAPLGVTDVSVDVVERVEGVDMLGESGGSVALFNFDLVRPDEAFLNKCIRYMRFHRYDLLELVDGLSETQLNHVPEGKSRNIEQILSHICNAEEWYISRLGSDADLAYEENLGIDIEEADKLPVFERMRVVRRGCVDTLRQIIPLKTGVFTRADFTSYPTEQWTARKVLRRFLEHEREHIYNIRWYLGKDIRAFP